MTGFSGTDRFDWWVFRSIVLFVIATSLIEQYAPSYLTPTTLLLYWLVYMAFSALEFVRGLNKTPHVAARALTCADKPVHNLTAHSTMGRHRWNTTYWSLPKDEALRRLVADYKMARTPVDFTVDEWKEHYDYRGARQPAGRPKNKNDDAVVIYWYEPREQTTSATTDAQPLPRPPVAPTKRKPNRLLSSRGGLGASALFHGRALGKGKKKTRGVQRPAPVTVDSLYNFFADEGVGSMPVQEFYQACMEAGLTRQQYAEWIDRVSPRTIDYRTMFKTTQRIVF